MQNLQNLVSNKDQYKMHISDRIERGLPVNDYYFKHLKINENDKSWAYSVLFSETLNFFLKF